jgi:HD superfamily phosphohydrolase YqeK
MINIEENKQAIIELLADTLRPGINELIQWLEALDFFTAPASAQMHLSEPGGLAQHSLNVLHTMQNKMVMYADTIPQISDESIVITALLHDLCKVNFYQEGAKYPLTDAMAYALKKDSIHLRNAVPEDQERFMNYFFIPGTRAVKMDVSKDVASKVISWLKDECTGPMPETPVTYKEADDFPLGHGEKSLYIAERFIKLTDDEALAIRWHMGAYDISSYYGNKCLDAAFNIPLVVLLHTADLEAARILEVERDGTE